MNISIPTRLDSDQNRDSILSADPLRILMILRAPIGGLYRHVIDLANELGNRGHAVGLITDNIVGDAQTSQRIKEMQTPPELGVHSMPIPRMVGFGDVRAFFAIRRIASKLNAHVLHGHGAKGGLNARLSRISNGKRISVYTPHGGVLNYDQRSLVGRSFRIVEAGLLPITDAVIFESSFAKSAFQEQIGAVKTLGPVIHNGLSPNEFAPLPREMIDHDFSFVGELRSTKGLKYFFAALAAARRTDGKLPTAIIAGSGPDEQTLKAQVRTLGLENNVTFVGVQPARSVFARGGCAVMPSLAESLPYVALEASAGGRPLIATNVGGVSEIFGPTSDQLVPAADSTALLSAMQRFLEHPHRCLDEMEVRLSFVRERFSIATMVDAVEACYRTALGNR